MRYDHETGLAVSLPVGNSDCMRSTLDQEVRIELPRLIGLLLGSHGTSGVGKFELERLHYWADRIEDAATRRAGKVQSDNLTRLLVNNDRA